MKTKKPKTPLQWSAWRYKANLEMASDALTGKKNPTPGPTRQEYVLYCFAEALKELPALLRVNPCPSVVKKRK